MKDTKEKNLNSEDLGEASGGMDCRGGIWNPRCAKCGKLMPGGMGVTRVDGTTYEHPYFCKECADSLTDAEKNK